MDPPRDKEDPEKKPPSRDRADLDPAERQFWGSDDEEEELAAGHWPGQKSDEAQLHPGLEDAGDPFNENLDDPEELEQRTEAPEEPGPSNQTSVWGPARQLTRPDFIWMGALGAVLLGLGIYALSLFSRNINTASGPDSARFPVTGEKVVIAKVDTFWRTPDREVDKVKIGAQLIPCGSIKLKSGSGSGRLRFFFENEEGEFVGDTLTLAFSDGKFATTGNAEAEISATDGFEHEGEYAAYVTEQVHFWYVNILEGPDATQANGKFKELVRVRISPKRR